MRSSLRTWNQTLRSIALLCLLLSSNSLLADDKPSQAEVDSLIKQAQALRCNPVGGVLHFSGHAGQNLAKIRELLPALHRAGLGQERIEISFPLTFVAFREFQKFPNWKTIDVKVFLPSNGDTTFLPLLKNLTSLEIYPFGEKQPPRGDLLAQFPRLRELNYHALEVSGKSDALKRIPTLERLTLRACHLQDDDLRAIGQIKTLTELSLAENTEITSASLKHLTGLSQLKTLHLKWAKLRDDELAPIAKLTNLRTLRLHRTGISDRAFVHFAGLKNLELLDVTGNNVRDAGFRHLSELTQLTKIELMEADDFNGTGFQHVVKSPIRELDLTRTHITDAGLEQIGKLKHLRILKLPPYDDSPSSETEATFKYRITDAGLKHLLALNELEVFSVGSGGITDRGLAQLEGLKNLRSLHFGACPKVTGTCLANFARLPKLESLTVDETYTSGIHLQPLDKHPRLSKLFVGPKVSSADAAAFELRNPHCQVHWNAEFQSAAMVDRETNGGSSAIDALSTLLENEELSLGSTHMDLVEMAQPRLPEIIKQFRKLQLHPLDGVDVRFTPTPELIDAISGMRKLKRLELTDIGAVSAADLKKLGRCEELTWLQLMAKADKPAVAFSGLDSLKKIQVLTLGNVLLNAQALAGFSELHTLTLENLDIDTKVLATLYRLPHLTTVKLIRVKLLDATPERLQTAGHGVQAHWERLEIHDPRGGLDADKVDLFAPLQSLQHLEIRHDQLRGLAGISILQRLRILQVWNFKERTPVLNDDDLRHVSNLKDLAELTIARTILRGPGLAHLKNLTSLRTLQFQCHSEFEGDQFRHLAGLRSLRNLELTGLSEYSGVGLHHLADTDIRRLYLQWLNVNDAGLASIKKLKNLDTLILPTYDLRPELFAKRAAGLTDAGLVHLGEMDTLHTLILGGPQITDAGLQHLAGMKDLKSLKLVNCRKITGIGFRGFNKLPNLEHLDIAATYINDESLKLLEGSNISRLHLPFNATTAALPFLLKLPQLKSLEYPPSIDQDALKQLKGLLPGLNTTGYHYVPPEFR